MRRATKEPTLDSCLLEGRSAQAEKTEEHGAGGNYHPVCGIHTVEVVDQFVAGIGEPQPERQPKREGGLHPAMHFHRANPAR